MEIWRRFVDPSSGRCDLFHLYMSTLYSRISAAGCRHRRGGVPAPGTMFLCYVLYMSVHVRTCPCTCPCDVRETKLPVSTMRHHHRAPAVPPPASTKTKSEAQIPLGLEREAPPLVWVTWRQLSHLRCLCMSVRCPYMSVHVRTCPYMSVCDAPLMSL